MEKENNIIVEVEGEFGAPSCPRCNSEEIKAHGKARPRKVFHGLVNGNRVYLAIRRQRLKCKRCGKAFTPGLPFLRPYSRLTKNLEMNALFELRQQSFSQVSQKLGIGYGTLRRILDRGVDQALALDLIDDSEVITIGVDEHSFRHQELVHTVTEVKRRMMLGILKDDRIASVKAFLDKLPKDKVKEVCIDMKEGLFRAATEVIPQVKVVVDPFHVIAQANREIDEARRIEQDARKGLKIPKKIFLIGREKLSEKGRQRVDELLSKYPSLKTFYWAKEKLRQLYHLSTKEEATRLLDLVILDLKASDDGELIRWGNSLKRWREPILNYFDNRTTNGFTEGCNTKIKMLKRVSYGIKNVDVYTKKILLAFLPPRLIYCHTN
jgi:transposase